MLRLVLVVGALTALSLPLIALQWLSVKYRLRLRRVIPVFYHRLVCRILGIRIHAHGKIHRGPVLIVSNHISWLDITVLTTFAPMVFVAKREVAAWPIFGLFAKLQRCVFVDRERRSATVDVNETIAARLAEGDHVVLFGEGTSSDGNRVLPFRSSLLGAAHAGATAPEVVIQPVSIAYIGLGGMPAGRQHRPQLAWYGGMDMLPHLGNILRRGAIDVIVTWGEPLSSAEASDRKALSRQLEIQVRRLTAAALRQPHCACAGLRRLAAPAPRKGGFALPQKGGKSCRSVDFAP
jgi:1-acyl-sn-glycerol-3-phosphate acyltransferase